MRFLHNTILAAVAGSASATTEWTTAADMREDMETIVKAQAAELQSHYQVLTDLEEVGSCASATVLMCDADAEAWDPTTDRNSNNNYLTRHSQFVNSETGTCVRYDLDEDGNQLDEPVTGRKTCLSDDWDVAEYGAACNSETVGDKCAWSAVEEVSHEVFESNPVSKHDALDDQKCTNPDLIDLCYINNDPDVYGYAIPDDASFDMSDDRPRAEICATNDLVSDIGEYSLSNVQQEYPQTAWSWLGMQETGIYRTWPGLYQCRTEAQCSGCSDPRFRGWYASAASGSKDVVIVIDTSGSMETSSYDDLTRLDYVKTAATWVVNTLSAADYFSVVSFSTNADEASETLLPATPENKAYFKDYINNLSPNGKTSMDKAFQAAFGILGGSTVVGQTTSGCARNILFLTDGLNTGGPDQDVLDTIRQYNGGPYEGEDLHYETGLTGEGLTLISTYSFGDIESSDLMKDVACENGGVYHTIKDEDAVHLKEVMGNYYTYMAAGMVPDSEDDDVPVRWVDIFEDGQGRGQETGACSPVYNWATSPPELFGILCLGIWMPVAESLAGWTDEWAAIQEDQAVCHNLYLSWEELESLRSKKIGSKQYTGQCDGRNSDSSTDIALVAAIGGAVGGALLMCALCRMMNRKKQYTPPQQQVQMARAYNAGGPNNPSAIPVAQPVVAMTASAPPAYR